MWHLWCDTFPYSFLYSKSKIKEKENNDLAVLPSHDKYTFHPNIRKPSDHVLLTIEVGIKDINIDTNI